MRSDELRNFKLESCPICRERMVIVEEQDCYCLNCGYSMIREVATEGAKN